jgi:hypothetical protein
MQQHVHPESLWGFRPSIVRAMAAALVELVKDKFLAGDRNLEATEIAS